MKHVMLFSILTFALVLVTANGAEATCHPQCSWKCDDPHCPAICDPVCEPPRCHTSCAEPKNAICDVKCEKPQCEIKCPDKGCEMFDCPKCVTVCKQPHCVTHCQAPKPECEPVCEEPKCDWKCKKPACPKPKCELVCENPNCVPKVECCNCSMGAAAISHPFPIFKESETNRNCCGCGSNQFPSAAGVDSPAASSGFFGGNRVGDTAQVVADNKALFSRRPQTTILNNGERLIKVEKTADVEMFAPQAIGTGQLSNRSYPNVPEYQRDRRLLNLNMIHNDKK